MRLQRQSNGQIINIDPVLVLGAGGEARIFKVPQDHDLAAKIYHKPTATHAHKLISMIANPPEGSLAFQRHSSIAWPVDVLRLVGGGNDIIGFLMPFVAEVRPIISYYHPKTRRQQCPLFNYFYLHRTAYNLAVAVRALHVHGYVIGDVNESNILVTETALVTLVDTDSFQVRDINNGRIYRCPVGKPEFTPPELQGKSFSLIDRAPEHDLFGLGVLIFQLLMEGTHPFAGVFTGQGESPLYAERISAGHFPYSHSRRRYVPYRPVSVAPLFEILHPALQELFIRCFEDGHDDPQARPDAQSWQDALREAEDAIVTCPYNEQHRYSNHLNACPWCERAKLLGGRDPFPSKQAVQQGLHLQSIAHRQIPLVPATQLIPPAPAFPPLSSPASVPIPPSFSKTSTTIAPKKSRGSFFVFIIIGLTFIAIYILQTTQLKESAENKIEKSAQKDMSLKETVIFIRNSNFFTIDADGVGNEEQLTRELPSISHCGWLDYGFGGLDVSRDGQIAFDKCKKYSEEANIYYFSFIDGATKQLTFSNDMHSPSFSPDGTKIAVGRVDTLEEFTSLSPGNGIWLIDVKGGQYTKAIGALPPSLCPPEYETWYDSDIVWSPDGEYLAFARVYERHRKTSWFTTYIVNRKNNEVEIIHSSDKYEGMFTIFDWKGDFLLLQPFQSAIQLYNFKTKETIKIPNSTSGCFSPSGKYVVFLRSRGKSTDLCLFDVGSRSSKVLMFDSQIAPYGRIQWSLRGNKIAFEKQVNTIKGYEENQIWSINIDGTNPQKLAENATLIKWALRPVNQSRQLTTTDQRTVRLVNHDGIVGQVIFDPTGRFLVTGSADGTIRFWNTKKEKISTTDIIFSDSSFCFLRSSLSPDGNLLAWGQVSGKNIHFWSVLEKKEVGRLGEFDGGISAITFGPNGKILATGNFANFNIKLWDVTQSIEIVSFPGHTGEITSLAFSPNGKIIASCSTDSTIRLWNLEEKKLKAIYQGHTNGVTSVAFSLDGSTLVSASLDSTIRVWDLIENRAVQVFHPGHDSEISSIAFSSDGKVLVSGGYDGSICFWDIAKSKKLKIFRGFPGAILSVAFSRDGKMFAYSHVDGSVYVWRDFDIRDSLASTHFFRNLASPLLIN